MAPPHGPSDWRGVRSKRFLLQIGIFLFPAVALAADLEGTFQNLVTAFVGRILPIFSLAYLGKNIFAHIQSKPEARDESYRIVAAIAALLAINAVWAYIQRQVR